MNVVTVEEIQIFLGETDTGEVFALTGRLETFRVRLVAEPVFARRSAGEMGIPDARSRPASELSAQL